MAEITLQDIIQPENLVYEKSKLLTEKPFHYCPGCGHGTVHRIIAEVLEELGVDDRTIGVSPPLRARPATCSMRVTNFCWTAARSVSPPVPPYPHAFVVHRWSPTRQPMPPNSPRKLTRRAFTGNIRGARP